jgi:hypothetical protein
MANQIPDEQQRKIADLWRGKSIAFEVEAKRIVEVKHEGERKVKRAAQIAVAAKSQKKTSQELARQAMSFAEAIASQVNA